MDMCPGWGLHMKTEKPKSFRIGDVMSHPQVLGQYFAGDSWNTWRAVMKAAFAEPMTDEELANFTTVAGGRSPPLTRCSELACIVGRGGGKDSIASLMATTIAINFDPIGKLRPGELATIICIACDRDQAKIVFNYIRGYFEEVPALAKLVKTIEKDSIILANRVEIMVETNSYRSVRGRSFLAAIFDEVAFWRSEGSAVPDKEVANAVGPGLTRVPGSMSILISTAHRRTGLLYDRFQNFYGKDNDDTLVVLGTSQQFNPILDAAKIAAAIAKDPQEANAEYNSIWRDDLAGFLQREVIEAAVDSGVPVRPPQSDIHYFVFVDNSGGRSDSFALAISHFKLDGTVILDLIREWRPPQFSNPSVVVAEMAQIAKSYRCQYVKGDAYGANWAEERFREVGLGFRKSDLDTSGLYLACLPKFASGQVRLVDNARLVQQFVALERRTMPGGRDKIEHPRGGNDDLSNSVSGALVMAALGLSSINTGSGVGIYSAYGGNWDWDGGVWVERSEIRTRLEAEMLAQITPDSADHVKGYRGPEQQVGDLLQLFRERPEEADAIVSDLENIRVNSGDVFVRRIARQAQREIQVRAAVASEI